MGILKHLLVSLLNKNCNTDNLLIYILQIVTSNNMAQEEHIGLIYNSMICYSIWN